MFRLRVFGDVVVMMAFHVNGIKIAATEELTKEIVSTLNQRVATKYLGEAERHMGSDDKKDRKDGTLEISWTQFHLEFA